MRLRSSSVSSLPWDLLEEILARVPATSLQRLQSTCKQWNALFSDQRFIKKHFDKAAKQYLVLLSRDYRYFSVSVNQRGLHDNNIDPSIEVKGGLSLADPHYHSDKANKFEVVFHCDGLLLCITTNNRLVFWNPCTGQTKWIQRKSVYNTFYMYAFGYENNKSCHNYKIMRFLDGETFELEIYEFNSNSWRVLYSVTPDFTIVLDGVSLKENTYWVARDKTNEEFDNEFLISFDFTRERFGPRVPSV